VNSWKLRKHVSKKNIILYKGNKSKLEGGMIMMTKDALNTGMIVEYDNGRRGMVIREIGGGGIIMGDCDYSDIRLLDQEFNFPGVSINRVYEKPEPYSFLSMLKYPGKLIWERRPETDWSVGGILFCGNA
jgi:hypothetical protein